MNQKVVLSAKKLGVMHRVGEAQGLCLISERYGALTNLIIKTAQTLRMSELVLGF